MTLTTNSIFQLLEKLALRSELKASENGFEYQVQLSEETIISLKEDYKNGLSFDGLKVDEQFIDIDELSSFKGRILTVQFSNNYLRQQNIFIYTNFEDFLAYKPNLLTPPENFIILEQRLSYSKTSDVSDHKLLTYFNVCRLLSTLNEYADHQDRFNSNVIYELVFLHKSRMAIVVNYSIDCLDFGLDGISIFNSLFSDPAHKDQKLSILKEVMFGFLININKTQRLDFLIQHFGEFSKRLNENYQLFVSEFSFDDVRREYEEKKRDYLVKINDVFAQVQTKMLGIPISLALISFKMGTIIDSQTFWANLTLLIAILAYTAMMSMLIEGQKATLTSLKDEYTSHMNRLKHQYPEQFEKIKKSIDDLDKREKSQRKNLNSFYFFGLGLLILTFSVFLFYLPWKTIMGIS
ncbi:hypothetical protein [Paraglaciecola sp. 25GB23A]|uniref:hypothetical protein n=1 Tax=Paraglaciecola sp. 25GB23A TaxID=3156068 RepID=UPI0032AF10E5